MVRGADLIKLILLQVDEPVQSLLEVDDSPLSWLSLLLLCELLHCLLSLFNVIRLAQIINNSLSFVYEDSCLLLDSISGFGVLLKIFYIRQSIFDLYVFSYGLINALTGILDVHEISN